MKKISAVICELNPLHDGHKHIFNSAKERSDILIAVMSGNFVQRGETAVYHKYKRAESALRAGADIVVELPFPFCSSSAEYFAFSGVKIAEEIGCETLYFGSECGDIDELKKAGEALATEEYRMRMSVGRSAKLRSEILRDICKGLPESLYSSPNDILGAEYCRRASIETVAIKRISCESASSIRARFLCEDGCDMLSPNKLRDIEFCFFRTQRESSCDCSENGGGVYERLYKTAFSSANSAEWELAARTKQYTNARLRRAALFSLCAVTDDILKSGALFTNLLGATAAGREYLSEKRKDIDFPIITNHSQSKELSKEAFRQYELSVFADSVYALCMGDTDPAYFLKQRPVML